MCYHPPQIESGSQFPLELLIVEFLLKPILDLIKVSCPVVLPKTLFANITQLSQMQSESRANEKFLLAS